MRTDATLLPDHDLDSAYRTVDGVRFHVVTAGDESAPLVVLLHGFPEFWYGWRHQIEPLVDAGCRVLVPDQRGYNLSAKPDRLREYRVARLARDVVALIHSEGRESAHVVGHDWGAAVAWELALRCPNAVDRLGICNVPHPLVFRRHLRSNPAQLRKSWYVFYFQLPWLPEVGARRNDFEKLVGALDRADPDAMTDRDLERYRAAWRVPGALSAMIDWYRAAVRYRETPPRRIVEAPTLIVWGERDFALEPEMAPESLAYCAEGRLERFPDVGHWVLHDRPEAVADLLADHLAGG